MAIGPPIKRRQLFILAMAAAALATASLIIFYSGKFASGAAQEKLLQQEDY
jgi:hypothetical protein